MKLRTMTLPVLLLALSASPAFPWGDDGHHLILEGAMRALPPDIQKYYAGKWRDLKRFSVEPDRRSAPVAEGSRHYLDIEKMDPEYLSALRAGTDKFGPAGYADEDARDLLGGIDGTFFGRNPPPWKGERVAPLWMSLPPSITEYRRAIGREEIFIGSVVYQPYLLCRALARALSGNDRKKILLYTGYLAHYAGDVSMPLHLTANYKGQFSGNLAFAERERGDVHARFETGFVKSRRETVARILKESESTVRPLEYEGITPQTVKIASESYAMVERLLQADLKACASSDPRRDWEAYLERVSPGFLPLVGSRLQASSSLLAGLLLTAWKARSTNQSAGM